MNLILIGLLFSLLSSADGRSLYWDNIEVTAHLDDSGKLRVTEIQDMVMTGDWNGGERSFNRKIGSKFDFIGISRFDSSIQSFVPLKKGDLKRIHNWDYYNSNVIRWRSRKPSDEFFENTKLKYKLEYEYDRILKYAEGEKTYSLSHDFLFSDRNGDIKSFNLTLTLDPTWQNLGDSSVIKVNSKSLKPGSSYILNLDLKHTGAKPPSAIKGLSKNQRWIGYLSLIVFIVGFFIYFMIGEVNTGRFKSPKDPSVVDENFIETYMLNYKPEQIGTLWDEDIGKSEVAAVIARLIQEEKLSMEFKDDSETLLRFIPFYKPKYLRLNLLVNKRKFSSYENRLISGLFPTKKEYTDKYTLKKYYKNKTSGFDPSGEISTGLEKSIDKKKGMKRRTYPKIYLQAMGWPFLASIILYGASWLIYGFSALDPVLTINFIIFISGLLFWFFGLFAVSTWVSKPVSTLLTTLFLTFLPLLVLIGMDKTHGSSLILLPFLGCFCFTFCGMVIMMTSCFCGYDKKRNELRLNLLTLRKYLIKELKKEKPNLKDEWFPYLVALGLAKHVEKWTNKFEMVANTTTYRATGTSGGYSSGSGWTGGGGGFSGAGATGSFASAVTSFASSASSAGSSSSSGGGSSGGGGGGGW